MTAFDWVKDVRVNFPTREVTIGTVPDKLDTKRLIEALAKAGFEDSSVRTP